MQKQSQKVLYHVSLEFPLNVTRSVRVKAFSVAKAEQRALKFNPNAIGIYRPGKKD